MTLLREYAEEELIKQLRSRTNNLKREIELLKGLHQGTEGPISKYETPILHQA